MPSKLQQVRVPLPDQQVAELAAAAQRHGISSAELIRRMLVDAQVITDPALKHGGDRNK